MPKTKDYQALSLELDEILAKLQQPNVRVDEAVKLYEQGLVLIGQLERHLEQAENKIEQLKLSITKPTET
ncbi:MAG: exodeoxyribonuclease VII small subunit [Patescibacteria group bacterium]